MKWKWEPYEHTHYLENQLVSGKPNILTTMQESKNTWTSRYLYQQSLRMAQIEGELEASKRCDAWVQDISRNNILPKIARDEVYKMLKMDRSVNDPIEDNYDKGFNLIVQEVYQYIVDTFDV